MIKLILILVAGVFVSSCARTSSAFRAGLSLLDAHDYNGAVDSLSRAIADDTTKADAYLQRSRAYLALHDYPRAIEDCDKALRCDAGSVKAFHMRAFLNSRTGNYDSSIVDYARALGIDSTDSKIYVNRGNLYLDLKDTNSALDDYSRALDLNPKDHLALLNRARIYRELGDSISAFRDLDQASVLRPVDHHTSLDRGLAFLSFANYPAAIAAFKAVLKADSSSADARYGIGVVHFRSGNFQQALSYLDSAISRNPDDSEAYYYRALTRCALGDTAGACDDFTEAIARGYSGDFRLYQEHCR